MQLSHELFANALQMFVQVYGPMHLDTANCYRLAAADYRVFPIPTHILKILSCPLSLRLPPPFPIPPSTSIPSLRLPPFPLPLPPSIPPSRRHLARIGYMVSDYAMALSNQHKATLILERVLGVDHPETVSAYINLALYCQANGQSPAALRLLYRWVCPCKYDVIVMSFSRARYLLLLLYGEDHPEMATCDSNIAVILHSLKDFNNSHTFLCNALTIQRKCVLTT